MCLESTGRRDLQAWSALTIQSLQKKHKHNLCLLPAHRLQLCHRMLSQRGSRNVPSEVPLPRKSGWSEDQFPLELVERWCRGPGIRGLPDALQLDLLQLDALQLALFIPCVEWGVGGCWASHSAGDKLLTGVTLLPPFLSSMRPGSKAVSQQPRGDSILSPVPLLPHLLGTGIRGHREGRASRQWCSLREHYG